MGVYSSESITKYINFYEIIKEKEQNIHLQFSTLTEKINQERVGGAFLISIQKKDLLLFDSFDFVGFKQFIIDNDSTIIDNMLFNLRKQTQAIIIILYLSPFLSKHTKKLKKKTHWKT